MFWVRDIHGTVLVYFKHKRSTFSVLSLGDADKMAMKMMDDGPCVSFV